MAICQETNRQAGMLRQRITHRAFKLLMAIKNHGITVSKIASQRPSGDLPLSFGMDGCYVGRL